MASTIVAPWPDSGHIMRVHAMLICPFPVDMQETKFTHKHHCEATMTTFDKREEGFEKKFAHDQELRFKANARRNKMLGLWAAEKLGLSGDAVNAYAKEVIMADFEEAGEADVLKKVLTDLSAKGDKSTEADIRRLMVELMEKAIADIQAS